MLTRRAAAALAVFASLAIGASSARAEVSEVVLTQQYGLSYLTFEVMRVQHLVEKQLAANGLAATSVTWKTLSDGAVQNDALLSGTVHVAAGGIGAFVTLWDKTRSSLDVRAISALAATPALLNVRDANVKSIADLKGDLRVGVPGAKVSPQAITLQYAAAKQLGDANYAAYDKYTVNLSHPLAMQAMMSGAGEVIGHFSTVPYSFMELKDPKVHTILNSYEVWGGKQTLIVAWTTGKFARENPKTFAAVSAAIREATDWINANKAAAAQLYLDVSKDKLAQADILSMLNDPQNEFTMTPQNMMKFVTFKHQIGTMKNLPGSWKDMFFDVVYDRAGS
ncbi:MAG: ABC transporter substrate-binding protein [Hyphomicrobiales bacterium]|nr:ABC transporter substrate-binding protein [Hyphomicrobiales bacterium]